MLLLAPTGAFNLDGLEDQCFFDVAFGHEMGSLTQGNVVARSDGGFQPGRA
jgi:hypothetical protein